QLETFENAPENKLSGCWSVRRARQLDCKRFITSRDDIDPLNPALTMSRRLVMKRLQSNCQARRTDQQPDNLFSGAFSNVSMWLNKPLKLVQVTKFRRDLRNTLIWKQVWFCERLTWNPAESLVCDVSGQLNVLHQATSCFDRYDIRDIAIHAYSLFTTREVAGNSTTWPT
ncbi:hypothetical protein T265_15591, partial [Opisthorchis viverrini]